MKYRDAVQFLDNLTRFGIKLGLEPIKGLLAELGNPQKRYKSIQVAGTNGKGSTASFIASILTEAGYKVGLYTSPHLLEPTERIVLSRKPISQRKFSSLITNLIPVIEKRVAETGIPLSYFEVLTAAAFQYFAEEKVDFLVAEVGMGGRLDATNILKPLVCVITPISLEHTEYLGHTLAAVAREKCGIIKEGSLVVSSPQRREVADVIKEVCKKRNTPLYPVSRGSIHRTRERCGLDKSSPCIGKFQLENALVAEKTIESLASFGVRISKKNIKKGLLKTKISGRLQILSQEPLIIYDVGHNPGAVRALCEALKSLSPQKYIFVYGCLEGKDAQQIIKTIAPIARFLILTRPKSKRATEPEELLQIAKEVLPENKIKVISDPKLALRFALKYKKKEPTCIFGSFYLASSFKNLFRT